MNRRLIKIEFTLDPSDWHGYQNETLWASQLDTHKDAILCELQNSPFYAKGVSYLDIILARIPSGGICQFVEKKQSSGHSTYRILSDSNMGEGFEKFWRELERLGCTYESSKFGNKELYSVDVPPSSDLYLVYSILSEGETSGVWIFEEGNVGSANLRRLG